MRTSALVLAVTSALACASAPRVPLPVSETTRLKYTSADGSRDFVLFRPASYRARRDDRALVVMLHGCAQTADDMAKGTRMNAAAETGGFLVIYPEQPAAANPQKCWNWFTPQQVTRGSGEAALLAGLIDSVARAERIAATRISLVGISAGAAMAANVIVAYPERYTALAMHSGVPALAATDLVSALTVMRAGVPDDDALGTRALAAMGSRARPIPVMVLHGAEDKVVSPRNLRATARQWTRINAAAPGKGAPVEEHSFAGVGHAWSGGSAEGSFTAPDGPDATQLIVAFLRKVGAISPH